MEVTLPLIMSKKKGKLIVTGTDPSSKRGGIAYALPGYFLAMKKAGLYYEFIPTHHAVVKGGKWRFWVRSFFIVGRSIIESRHANNWTVSYIHVGGGAPSFFRKSLLAVFCRLMGVRVVMQLHGLEVAGYLKSSMGYWLFRLAVWPANALALLTPWWAQLLSDAGIDKKCIVIPNPMSDVLESTARLPLGSLGQKNDVVVLTMSRIEAGKGVDLVIEAMPLLPQSVRLIVAGDGGLLPQIKQRVTILGLESRVTFVGWVDDEEKSLLLQQTDIFCLPSSYDSFGMGFIEAMANGLPVVALNWGPICDVVPDGSVGILINDQKSVLLAEAITRLLDIDLRREMGINAKKWVLEAFSATKVGYLIKQAVFDVNRT
jgi:glycosyltransferase involved in cell wall biosynthesis